METAKIFIAISIFLIPLMVNNQKRFFDSFLEVFKTDEVSTKLLMDVAGDSLINPDFCISLESENTRNVYDHNNFTLFYFFWLPYLVLKSASTFFCHQIQISIF